MTVENTATETNEQAGAPAAPNGAASAIVEKQQETSTDENLLGDTDANEGANAQAEGDKPEEGDDLLEGKVGEDTAAGNAPDDYEAFAIPEGYEADAELAEISKPVFKELGLSQTQAQSLIDKLGPQILSRVGERMAAQWKQTQQGWAKDSKADSEIFDAAAKSVRPEVARGRDYLGAEFSAAIKLLGGNNHPAVLKALAKVGQALGEDTPGFGKPPVKQKSREEILYPNQS